VAATVASTIKGALGAGPVSGSTGWVGTVFFGIDASVVVWKNASAMAGGFLDYEDSGRSRPVVGRIKFFS